MRNRACLWARRRTKQFLHCHPQLAGDALEGFRLGLPDFALLRAVHRLLPNAGSIGEGGLRYALLLSQRAYCGPNMLTHEPEFTPTGLNVKGTTRETIVDSLNETNDLVVENESLGSRIRKRRKELKLSREQLADRMRDLGHPLRGQQIYRYESKGAEPSGSAAAVLEQALDVPPGWLLGKPSIEAHLSYSELISLLDELQVNSAARAKLSKHLGSDDVKNEKVTRTYVVGYLRGIKESGSAASEEAATEQAREDMDRDGRHVIAPKPTTTPKPRSKKRDDDDVH